MSESASGEASSSTNADGKDFSCPTCGRVFGTSAGVKQHHYAAHGESIAGEQITCEWCGNSKTVRPSHVSEHNFCNRECWSMWSAERQRNEVAYNCDWCGSEFMTHPHRIKESKRLFCPDSSCYGQWQSEHATGENARNWKGGRVAIDCNVCGSVDMVKPHRESDAKLCSRECVGVWVSENFSGKNSHHYDPTKTYQYGPNWESQRSRARERDNYRCQSCGKHEGDHYRELIVHHITPRKRFIDGRGVYDYETGNRLQNLVCVCDSCHQQWEGVPLRPTLND